jgi:hypothetical protein
LKGEKMRRAILDALRARYEAEIAEADAMKLKLQKQMLLQVFI